MTDSETVVISVTLEETFIEKAPVKQAPEKPEAPHLDNITHHSIDCSWKHVKDTLPKNGTSFTGCLLLFV